MTTRRVPLVASAMAIGAGAVWSLGVVTARFADQSDAFQYLIWRSVGIIVVVEILGRIQSKPTQTLRAFRSGRMMLIANVMLLIASLGFVYAVKTTTAANAAFLGSTAPVFGAITARLLLHDKLTRVTIASIVIAFVGLTVMVAGDLEAGSTIGNLSALSSAVGFAGYAVCVRSNPDEDWSPVLPGYGVLMIGICGAVTLAGGKDLVPPAADLAYALAHGAVIIVIGTFLFNIASREVPAVAMTVFAQVEMVLVPVWSVTFLDDRPPATTWIGGAIIFIAIIGKVVIDAGTQRIRPTVVMEPM